MNALVFVLVSFLQQGGMHVASNNTYEVCEHSATSTDHCALFEADTMAEALQAARQYVGTGFEGILTAQAITDAQAGAE